MRYRATYHKKGHAYGGGRHTYQGIAEGGGWKDSLGNWWIQFTEESGVFFGAVPMEDVVVHEPLTTEQARAMASSVATLNGKIKRS